MPRNPRCVLPEVAYHVTQRGVDRADVFFSQADRDTYLHLLHDHREDAGVRVLGWCIMTNHVHWIVAPEREDSLAVLFRRVHGRYAQYINARRRRSGHLWQNRFFSCAVAPEKEEIALRYVEWNPVRAAIVESPEAYRWSSAAAHLKGPAAERIPLLDWGYWRSKGGGEAWKQLLEISEDVRELHRLRRATYAGAPWGSAQFIADMERQFERRWRVSGRPRKGQGKEEKGTERSASVSTA
ncbi:MAG TPA: transposase [Bryobacteraceae bacterium]|nr:transposase [Bryobacteraceae bacterium]